MHKSKHDTVTATELVRNFSAIVDKVRMSGNSLYITKGIQTIAELSPPPKSGFPIQNLADFFKSMPHLDDDAQHMVSDLTAIKLKAGLPENPWG